MPADSLSDLARRACIKNSKRLFDIGGCPYDLIRPVLLKIESPEQLHQLEVNSPQIIGRTGEVWLNLIKRDIPDWQSKRHEPRDPQNWWKVYRNLKQEAQNDMEQGSEKLKAALNNIKDEKEQNIARLVTRRDMPRQHPSMKQRMTHNYNSGKTGSKGAHKLSLMEKIRKEVRDSAPVKMATPTKDLKKQASPVTKAPRGFLEDLKREVEQRPPYSPETAPIRAPRPPMALSRPIEVPSDKSFQEREARLRALTSGRGPLIQATMPIAVLDGSFSPPGRDQPARRRPVSAAQPPDPGSTSKGLAGDPDVRLRSSSPGIRGLGASPLKRKKESPSLFMETKKPKFSKALEDLF